MVYDGEGAYKFWLTLCAFVAFHSNFWYHHPPCLILWRSRSVVPDKIWWDTRCTLYYLITLYFFGRNGSVRRYLLYCCHNLSYSSSVSHLIIFIIKERNSLAASHWICFLLAGCKNPMRIHFHFHFFDNHQHQYQKHDEVQKEKWKIKCRSEF